MDAGRFDDLTRSLGRPASRRGIVGAVVAGLALGVGRSAGAGRRGVRPAATAPCSAPLKNCAKKQVVAGASLSGCDLADRDLAGRKLNNIVVSSASLRNASLAGSNLDRAVMSSACLVGANFAHASLRGAVLSGADLMGANLCGADLTGAVVKSSQLARTYRCCDTIMPNGAPWYSCDAGESCCGSRCTAEPCTTCDFSTPANPAACPADWVCCPTTFQPFDKCCAPETPSCCSAETGGGCCWAEAPTCCPPDTFWTNGYCSATGECDCPNGSCLQTPGAAASDPAGPRYRARKAPAARGA